MADYSQIIQEINTNLPDNNTQAITAAKLRETMIDLTTAIQTNETDFENGLVVDSLTSIDTTKALSANQGNVLDGKITDLTNNSIVKTELVAPRSSTATTGRLLADGSIYVLGTTWKYFIYDLDLTKKYVANLSIIKVETGRQYCGVQYFNSSDTCIGVEYINTSSTNIYNVDRYLNPPSGTTYCYVQSVNYTGYDPSKLWIYDYTAATLEEVNDELDDVINRSTYFPDIQFTPQWGAGSVTYSSGLLAGTTNSNTGWVNVEGITRILYSRMVATSTTSTAGMAFYSSQSTSGYISGQRCKYGQPTGGYYEDTYINVPSEAKWARFSIWGTSPDDTSYADFKVRDASETKYLDQNVIKDIAEEVAEEVVANKPLIDLTGKKISIIGDSISAFGTETQTRTQGYNAPYWIVKTVDVGNQIQAYVTWLDVYNTINAGSSLTNKTIGGVTLTAAMIGTLQTFTPVAGDVGKEIGVARWASSYTTKPWWQVVIDKTGATLCNNASWSGSRICEIPEGNDRHDAFVMSEAYSDYTVGRLRNRDDEGNFINPDIILIYRGVNDLVGIDPEGGSQGESGVEDLTTPNLLTWDENNFNTHNFTEAYIHTILKLRRTYPDVYIVLCTLNVFKRSTTTKWPTNNGTYSIPDYNNKIREIANIMGCGLIEFDKDGITYENCYPDFISDSASAPIHPNTNGHRVMGEKAVTDIRYKFEPNS